MNEFSDELTILLTESDEESENFSSVLSSLPTLSSVYNKNENDSGCVGIVFGDKFIPTKPKVGSVKEWRKKSVWGEGVMDKESKEMEDMIMKAIREEKARMEEEGRVKAMKTTKEEEARMEEEETEMEMKRRKIDDEEVRQSEKEVEVINKTVKEEEVKEKEEKTDVKQEMKEERTIKEEKKEEASVKEEKTIGVKEEMRKAEKEVKVVKEAKKEESIPEETAKEEEVKAKEETTKKEETAKEEEANTEKETIQTEETTEAVVASEAKNPPTVIQNEETPNFATVKEETKTDEAEEGLPVQIEESEELLRNCLGTIRQEINGVTVTLGLKMGDSPSTCTLVVCRRGAYDKFFNMQKDDVPFTVCFMDKRYPFSVGVESSMKEVRQRAISVLSVSSPYE